MAKYKIHHPIAVGDRFGKWIVVSKADPYINPSSRAACTRWHLRCECGREGVRNPEQLRSGQSQHCGCLTEHRTIPIGTRFGKLVVSGESHATTYMGRQHHKIECLCDCGTTVSRFTTELRADRAKSCGRCPRSMSVELKTAISLRNRTHGQTDSPEYRAWSSMKKRCLNPRHGVYARYGARGITVCERWIGDFPAFLSDMGPRPSADHSLERVDNNLGYSPSNCEWRSRHAQNRNRRNTVFVRIDGRDLPLAEAAEMASLPYGTVWRRVTRFGWPIERALSQAPRVIRTSKAASKRGGRFVIKRPVLSGKSSAGRNAIGTYSADDVRRIYRLQRGRCAYCRDILGDAFRKDHILPIALGGTNFPRNIQLTCQKCNATKGAMRPEEFAAKVGRLL